MFGSSLAQAMAWCLTTSSHYLNQCWVVNSQVLWQSHGSNFTASAQATILYNECEKYTFEIALIYPRGQWVKMLSFSFPVVSIGNPASSSDTLLRYSQDISFILLDYDLVNGTLHAFEFTTASRIAALRLQIWRLQRASLLTPHPYLLIYEQAHTSAEARNHTVGPDSGWRHQMEKKFRVTGHLCGEFTDHRWIPAQKPVTRSFDVFFGLRLNKRLSKQSLGWWFETPSRPLWRYCNVVSHHT